MKEERITITALSSISPLGCSPDEIWKNYLKSDHHLVEKDFGDDSALVAPLSDSSAEAVKSIRNSDQKYKTLDASVLYAMQASRLAVKQAGWEKEDCFGINIGSSRGATGLFEKYHEEFLREKQSSTLASPTTTLGNISSWIAHDLQSEGPELSHSITCSTALHALVNGVAWIKSGMSDKFLVGGSEASLTPFTIAQMKALKIYAENKNDSFPCKALDLNKKRNSMVLGEGAAVICMEIGGDNETLAYVEGVGYATEVLKHNISISDDAICFQKSMKMALKDTNPDEVDVIVMHAPGTIKGDSSEVKAIEKVFGDKIPALTTNKWKIGHTFGASGLLSLELGVLMMQNEHFINVPYLENKKSPEKIKKILINAVGFGGNAVSVLLSKP
ncbi:beta-ketoacyl synthase N-terminal-like domain-containing protein [Galbibacter sp. EGI 63066]|uniref:beta-ketoacyl synthase N-terminal-like domain-containing protein n=1 Tax=Galbibacter sp. EGI 63066 TaxID=2993559 RepID=UPI0022498D02|nr:beta-ketoacyl synthase N-terminal-like domain-containing protein [Galbibacter sp. EGI 63066]MCX2680511.1 beta-ketoacyl synthase N-terminal-like domain-containing protein [Galbibacter sp. EGI 63066]